MKRCPELLTLSREHHTALLLARRAQRAAQARATEAVHRLWREVDAYFHAELAPHFRIEEDVLLPALERVGETDAALRVRAEHRDLRRLVDGRDGETSATLAAFADGLARHVRYEEREVFEAAQARLGRRDLAAIAAACAASAGAACAAEDTRQDGNGA